MAVLVGQLLIKKSIDAKHKNDQYKHFHQPLKLYREKVLPINDIWARLPRGKSKREVAMNACAMNYKRLLTQYERQLIEKLDQMGETHRLLSDQDKSGMDNYLGSQENAEANGMFTQTNKHLLSMLPDMHIYENNMASFEQKLMEGMRHERSIALLQEKEEQMAQLTEQNGNLCEFCLAPESAHTPAFHCPTCNSKKSMQARIQLECRNKCLSCIECIQKGILAQVNNCEPRPALDADFRCVCSDGTLAET